MTRMCVAAYYGLTTYNYVMQVQAEEKRATAYLEDNDSDSISTDEDDEAAAGPPIHSPKRAQVTRGVVISGDMDSLAKHEVPFRPFSFFFIHRVLLCRGHQGTMACPGKYVTKASMAMLQVVR